MSNLLSPEEKRKIQAEAYKALKELGRLCDKHGLRYYITAGTLLGAVRHGGFIPWDDDIDVVMPRSDYKRLAKIAKSELADGFFYQSDKTERHCPFSYAKIRKDGTRVDEELLTDFDIHKGCYVDIFPLDSCPRSDRRARRFFKLTELIYCALISKINKSFVCGYSRGGVQFLYRLVRLLPRRALIWLRGLVRVYYTHTARGGKLCTVAGSYGYPRESYPEQWFGEAVMITFEDGQFPAPKEWRELLTHMYGDYMTPPDDKERYGHFIKTNTEEV